MKLLFDQNLLRTDRAIGLVAMSGYSLQEFAEFVNE